MGLRNIVLTSAALVVGMTGAALADSHVDKSIASAIKARQAHMQLYAFNLGILGGMAKGDIDYNADLAGAVAADLAALAGVSQFAYWPEGSDSDAVPESRALPIGWTQSEDAMAKGGDLKAAADKMAGMAGTDLASLQAGMAELGGACGACHKVYRKPQ